MNIYSNAKEMQLAALEVSPTNNFTGSINNFSKENATIETDLFDLETLDYYARKNCGLKVTKEEQAKFETEYRGGLQGDYSLEMNQKISNVVDSLIKYPQSKRSVIMMNNTWWMHDDTDEAKCCRELHFYLTQEVESDAVLLNCSGIFQAILFTIVGSGYLEKELSRYEYQHIRWKKKGKDNTQLALQVDAISQGLANASFLALPIFITATNTQQSFGPVEILGICIWGVALLMESIADFQKLAFLKRMKKEEKRNQVCNVGLWKYSRHPNYFAEWMVWNGLVVMALPSWLALKDIQSEIFNDQVDQILWLLLGAGLIYVSRMMYLTLVYGTGAIPAEHYSVQKRPGYKDYQKTTNRFFPGPPK
jgi:steroid 5-alpha reductase family enzyme